MLCYYIKILCQAAIPPFSFVCLFVFPFFLLSFSGSHHHLIIIIMATAHQSKSHLWTFKGERCSTVINQNPRPGGVDCPETHLGGGGISRRRVLIVCVPQTWRVFIMTTRKGSCGFVFHFISLFKEPPTRNHTNATRRPIEIQ